MTYAIQQFHATTYQTVAEARTLEAALKAAGEIKRKAPELPVRIEQIGLSKYTTQKGKPHS